MTTLDLIKYLTNLGASPKSPEMLAARRLEDQEREIENWRLVAAELASMHAATLEGLPKASSKRERSRFTSICTTAVSYLRGKSSPPWYGGQTKSQRIESSIKRCEEAAQKYGVAKAAE